MESEYVENHAVSSTATSLIVTGVEDMQSLDGQFKSLNKEQLEHNTNDLNTKKILWRS